MNNPTPRYSLHHVARACLTCILAGAAGGASAQAAAPAPATAPEQLERVMITAEKRATALDMTPDAITALDGKKLKDRGENGLADIATLAPNVSYTSNLGASQLFIRGIGNVFITAGGDPGVALYTDGAYVSDMTSANTSLFDVQRVEILRGPQGALYGRNATGGAVNILSAPPTSSFRAQAGVLFGNYGRKESEGFVSGPLGDSGTSARLSYQVKSKDGFADNALAGQTFGPVLPGGPTTVGPRGLDDHKSTALRLQTLTELGGGASVRLIAGAYRQHDNGPNNSVLLEPVPLIPELLFGVAPSADPRHVKAGAGQRRIDVNSLQAIYDQPIGDNSLTVVASHRRSSADVVTDGDMSEASMATTRFKTSSRDTSIDAHLASGDQGPLRWLVGATVINFDQQQDIDVPTVVPLGFLMPGQPLNVPVPLEFELGGKVRTRSIAAYGDVRYALTPQLAVLGGLRMSRDRKSAEEYQRIASFGVNAAGAPSASWSSLPGSIGLEWQPNPDALMYAKLSRGFKSGAINLGAIQPDPVKPETVTSIELGTKLSFLDKRASLAAAVFSSNYKNMQVVQIGAVSPMLTNAAGAKISGLELELAAKPVAALTMGAGLGLMDPKYTDFVNTDQRHAPLGPAVNTAGNQLANVSKAQANLYAELVQAFGDLRATFRADYVWRSNFYFTEFNTADAQQGAYGLLNLSASLRPANGPWKVYGYVRNATNTTAFTSMSITSPILGAARTVNYTPPRHFGVGFTYDF